jgi:hypothetical protein
MPRHRSNKERYNFLIDKSVYDDFSLICEELGMVRSKKLENYMKQFAEENRQVLKKFRER